ncbi:MAG: D-amino acid aminotransferase [Steroidobacteraceae bacterium]
MAEPLQFCHLNGQLLPLDAARISPLDRSFLFGDGVYEVVPVYAGRLFRAADHLDRLSRSAAALRLREPHDRAGWLHLMEELIAANGGGDQYLYLQLSRGAEWGRNHAPLPQVAPTVFAFCSPWPQPDPAVMAQGLACITAADNRWGRCDIKSVALLGNILLRQLAVDAGVAEAILLRDGHLTEASASAVHVVLDGVIVTPPNSSELLPGTSRRVVEELADQLGIARRDAPVTESQLRHAQEIWLSAATREVQPVTRLDGEAVGSGRPGPLWRRIYDAWQGLKRR